MNLTPIEWFFLIIWPPGFLLAAVLLPGLFNEAKRRFKERRGLKVEWRDEWNQKN